MPMTFLVPQADELVNLSPDCGASLGLPGKLIVTGSIPNYAIHFLQLSTISNLIKITTGTSKDTNIKLTLAALYESEETRRGYQNQVRT